MYSLSKQGTPLPCLGVEGGLPRGLRRECLEAGGKSKDRLENWGIKATWAWDPAAGGQFRALCGSQPNAPQSNFPSWKRNSLFHPTLCHVGGAEIKIGGCHFIAALIWGSYLSVSWGYLACLKEYHYHISGEQGSFQAIPSLYGWRYPRPTKVTPSCRFSFVSRWTRDLVANALSYVSIFIVKKALQRRGL